MILADIMINSNTCTEPTPPRVRAFSESKTTFIEFGRHFVTIYLKRTNDRCSLFLLTPPPTLHVEDIATAGAAAAPVQCGKGAAMPSNHIISNGNHIM